MASKSYRKFMATGLSAAVVASVVAPVAGAAAYDDVKEGAWYEEAINYVTEMEYMKGTGKGFEPGSDMTRAQAAQLFANILGLDGKGLKADFSDVKEGAWYYEAIAAVKEHGVMSGSGAKFNPNATLTRGEMAAIIVRAYDLKDHEGRDHSFTDIEDNMFKTEIAILADLGIVDGVSAGKFAPKADVTRAQMASFIFKTEVPEVGFPEVTAVKAVDTKTVEVTVEGAWTQEDVDALVEAGYELTVEGKASHKVGKVTVKAAEASTSADTTTLVLSEIAPELVAGEALSLAVDGEKVEGSEFKYEAPATPEVTSVSAIDVNKLNVKFSSAVKVEDAKFTLKRGNVVYDATVKFSEDKKEATLETGAKLPEGDYTVTVSGLSEESLTGSVKVEAEAPKEIKVVTTSVQYADNNKVTFEVLNQYGTKFNVSTSDVIANAYNTTAGNDVATTVVSTNGVLAVELDNLASETSGANKAHKVGDNIRVTLTYKGITAQSSVTVTEVSGVSSLELKEVAPLKDTARITAGDNGLELPYTLVDQYGKEIKFAARTADKDTNNDIEVIDGVQFTSSNSSVIDVDTIVVNAEGKVTFNASAEGKARITALIPSTGKVAYIDVTVNKAPEVKSVDVNAPTALVAGKETIKLNVSAIDQYGTAVKSENLSGLTFASTNQALVKDASVKIENGQLVVTTEAGVAQAGQVTINVNNNGTKVGQVTFEVNPDAVVSSVSTINVTSLFENTGKDVLTFEDIKTKDQYGRAFTLSTEAVTITPKDGNANAVTGTLTTAGGDALFNSTTDEFTFTGTTVTNENEVFTLTVGGVSKEFTLASVATTAIDSYKLESASVIYGATGQDKSSAHAATLTLKGLSAGKEVALAGTKVTSFTTSNPVVADVDTATAKVFGLKAGEVTVSAYAGATKLATTTVTVSEAAPVATTVAFDDASKELTNTATYTNVLTVKDQYGVVISSPKGTFSSSDSTVASVDADGEVTTTAKDGKATISFVSNNGIVKSYEVVVK